MNLSRADIESTIRQAVGNPTVGPLADNAGIIADAIHQLLQPEPAKENRIIKTKEIPAAEERID